MKWRSSDIDSANIALKVQIAPVQLYIKTLYRRHNERDGVSNHRGLDYLVNPFFADKTSSGSLAFVTGGYPTTASNADSTYF